MKAHPFAHLKPISMETDAVETAIGATAAVENETEKKSEGVQMFGGEQSIFEMIRQQDEALHGSTEAEKAAIIQEKIDTEN